MQIHQLRMIVLCFLFQLFAGVRKKIVIKLRAEYPHVMNAQEFPTMTDP